MLVLAPALKNNSETSTKRQLYSLLEFGMHMVNDPSKARVVVDHKLHVRIKLRF